jgi:hypothetical protein
LRIESRNYGGFLLGNLFILAIQGQLCIRGSYFSIAASFVTGGKFPLELSGVILSNMQRSWTTEGLHHSN